MKLLKTVLLAGAVILSWTAAKAGIDPGQKAEVLEIVEVDASGNTSRWYLDSREKVLRVYGSPVILRAEAADRAEDKHLSPLRPADHTGTGYSLREAAGMLHSYRGVYGEEDSHVPPGIGERFCYTPYILSDRYNAKERTGPVVSIRAIEGEENAIVLDTIDWIHRAYLKIKIEEHSDSLFVEELPDDLKGLIESWDI